jgi:hypothetical protein
MNVFLCELNLSSCQALVCTTFEVISFSFLPSVMLEALFQAFSRDLLKCHFGIILLPYCNNLYSPITTAEKCNSKSLFQYIADTRIAVQMFGVRTVKKYSVPYFIKHSLHSQML